MKDKFKKIEKIVLFISVISIILGIIIITLYTHKNEDGIIHFGNIYFISVTDNEMSPKLKNGDLAIINKKDIKEYHINNIIAYYISDANGNITTKVSKIVDGYSNNEQTSYIFMVKANDDADKLTLSGGDIIGEWNDIKISKGASIIKFITTRLGLFVCTIIPLILCFIVEFILLILTYKDRNKAIY